MNPSLRVSPVFRFAVACIFGLAVFRISKDFLIPHLITQRERVKVKAMATTLDYLVPSFDHLIASAQKKEPPDPERFRDYITYYENVVKFLPGNAEAYGMLGFCYDQTEEPEKSLAALAKASALNPNFFWFHHNLAVLSFKNGHPERAITACRKALALKPETTFLTIRRSKIYRDIERGNASGIPVAADLKEGYQDCYRLLLLNLRHIKNISTGSHFELKMF